MLLFYLLLIYTAVVVNVVLIVVAPFRLNIGLVSWPTCSKLARELFVYIIAHAHLHSCPLKKDE